NKKKAKLPVYLGLSVSALLVLVTTIISIGYYSPYDLNKMDWADLSLFKSVSLAFLERFDYIIVAEWMMITVPTMIFLMWWVTHGVKRLYVISKKRILYVMAVHVLTLSYFFKTDYFIQIPTNFISMVGFWINFVCPIVLLPRALIK